MTKLKYDVSNVEPGQDFDTPIPEGLYRVKIEEIVEGVSKRTGDPMLTITYAVAKGDHKGRKVWDYIVLKETQEWKMRQFIDAIGLKAKGTLDTNKIEGEYVNIRVKHDGSEDGEYGISAKVKTVLAIPEEEAEEEVEAEAEVEEETEEGVEEEGTEEVEEEGEDDGLSWEELNSYSRNDLKVLIRDNELGIKVTKNLSDDDIRAKIAEVLEMEPEDEEEEGVEEEPEEGTDEEEEIDYNEMSVADLKATAKERGLTPKKLKKDLIKQLKKSDEEDDVPF